MSLTAMSSTAAAPSSSSSRPWSGHSRLGEFAGLQATALAVNGGDDARSLVLLGGRRHLALVDLAADERQANLEIAHRLPRPPSQHAVSVTKAAFAASSAASAAVAAGDTMQMLHVSQAGLSCWHSFQPHSRPVVDFDLSVQDSNCLATTSSDSVIHVWDTRALAQASATFRTKSSCSQIRWSPLSAHHLLSVHDDGGDLRLWDARRAAAPLRTLSHSHRGARVLSAEWKESSSSADGGEAEDGGVEGSWVMTAGMDCALRMLDLAAPEPAVRNALKTSVPVWKAKWTPFGHGFATVILPRLESDSDHSLFLWNAFGCDFPVHCFYGHRDVVLDFGWRKTGDKGDIQMVSWSKDQSLRVWQVDSSIQSKCRRPNLNAEGSFSNSSADEGEVKDDYDEDGKQEEESDDEVEGIQKIDEAVEHHSGGETLTKNSASVVLKSNDAETDEAVDVADKEESESVERFCNVLQREFECFRDRVSGGNLRVERLDWARRKCKFSLSFSTAAQAEHRVGVALNFPADYPEGGRPPTVALARGSTLDNARKRRLVKMVKAEARRRVERGSPCLDACLSEIEAFIGEVKADDAREADGEGEMAPSFPPNNILEGPMLFGDVAVPFPRTSGASFGGNGRLVCFGRAAAGSHFSFSEGGTPRTLANFYAIMAASQSPMATVTAAAGAASVAAAGDKKSDSLKRKGRFNIKKVATGSGDISAMNRKTSWPAAAGRPRFSSEQRQEKPGRVAVYNVERLFPFSRDLAEKYSVSCRDRKASCRANAVAALGSSSNAAARHWTLSCLAADALERHGASSELFARHPLGRALLVSLLDHAARQGDVQLAATMACVFASTPPPPPPPPLRPVLRKLPPPIELKPSTLESDKRRKKRLRKGGKCSSVKLSDSAEQSPSPTAAPPTPPPSTEKKPAFWFLGAGSGAGAPFASPAASSHSPYHTVSMGSLAARQQKAARAPRLDRGDVFSSAGSDEAVENFVTPYLRVSRSNSWTLEMAEESGLASTTTTTAALLTPASEGEEEEEAGEDVVLVTAVECSSVLTSSPFSENDDARLELLKRAYADVLGRWGLDLQRALVLKTCYARRQPRCNFGQGMSAVSRSSPSVRCCICRLPVRGMARGCPRCGHAGHFAHWTSWFRSSGKTCPAPLCGCDCKRLADVDA